MDGYTFKGSSSTKFSFVFPTLKNCSPRSKFVGPILEPLLYIGGDVHGSKQNDTQVAPFCENGRKTGDVPFHFKDPIE